MAKTSQINRNKKREKLVAQYASKRAELKKIAEDMKVPAEERFAARRTAYCATSFSRFLFRLIWLCFAIVARP